MFHGFSERRDAARTFVRCAASLVVLVLGGAGAQGEGPAESMPPSVVHDAISSTELARLARALDDPRFAQRERATKQLERLGTAGLPAVLTAVRSGTPESQSRALSILKTWSLSENRELQQAAVESLTSLADSGESRVAREASALLAWRRHAIHQSAVEFLESLDARVTTRQAVDGFITSVQFSAAWRGNDEDLERLRDVEGITWLSIEDSRIGNRGMEIIVQCPRIEFLLLGNSRVTAAGLHGVKRLEKIQHLSLQELPLQGDALAALGPMPQLQSLGLDKTRMSDDDLVHLRGFPNLKNLWLDYTDVTDKGLAHVKQLTGLTHLYLAGTRCGGRGLEHLHQLPQLVHLSLKEVQMSPEGMQQLRGLKTLTNLGLDHTNVTDDMLTEIEGMEKLEVLWLSKTAVTDRAFEHLLKLPRLTTVFAHGSQFTKEGVEQFIREKGNACRVHF